MNVLTISIASGIVSFVALVTCLASAIIYHGREVLPQVGDVWAHVNPGSAYMDPADKPKPFVQLSTILLVDKPNGLLKVYVQTLRVDGQTTEREEWDKLQDWDRIYKRLYRRSP